VPPRAVLCISIDCECDKGPGWRTHRPLKFDGVHVGIAGRLHPLFRRFGAKPTYLLSPELLRDATCAERLASLDGCELGTHLHGELAEPHAFEPEVTAALQRDYPPEVERAKLSWLTEAFRSAFGRSARSFRAGRFAIGPATLGILADLGYAVDSSVTPHVDWSNLSPGLSFLDAPAQPYHPDPSAPSRRGSSPILEVPVTIRPGLFSRIPLAGRFVPARWLRPTKTGTREMIGIAREAIAAARVVSPGSTVVLNAMFHNVEVVAGASPYAATEADATRIVERLSGLLDFARREEIATVTLADVREALASEGD
jgi:hypothetical protein